MAQESQERSWMKAVKRGDFEAFEHLYRAYYRRLYGFFYRLCWDSARAEDLLQETFIKLWSNALKIDLNRPLAPWLYQVGKNLFLDGERKRKREENALGTSAEAQLGGAASPMSKALLARTGGGTLTLAEAPRADTAITRKETEKAVRAALETLDADKRLVVVLSFYQGLPFKDIAEILEVPVGTIKSRMHYAEKHLREVLKPMMSEA